MLDGYLQQISNSTDELRTENRDRRARLDESAQMAYNSRSEKTTLQNSLNQSTQTVEQLRTEMSDLHRRLRELQEAFHAAESTSTSLKRTSVTAFSPDMSPAEKVAVLVPTRSHASQPTMPSVGTQLGSSSNVLLTTVPLISDAETQAPSRRSPQPQPATLQPIASYPEDTTTIGRLRIDLLAVQEGKWAAKVPNIL